MRKSDATRSKILKASIKLFAEKGYEGVAIADVAQHLEITPQGIYRYFGGKQELFEDALLADLDWLHLKVFSVIKDKPLPSLTGMLWNTYSAMIYEHPLAIQLIPQRNQKLLELMGNLPSTKRLFKAIEDEAVIAQKYGLLRQDIDFRTLHGTIEYFNIHVLMPLIFEGKYGTPEWMNAAHILVANGFYPVPDLSSTEKIREFEVKITETIEKILIEQEHDEK